MREYIHMIKKRTVYIGIFMLTACNGLIPEAEFYQPDYTPEIGVFALISTDETFEFVVVERTKTIEEKNYWNYNGYHETDTIIKDAVVKIISGEDTVQFSFFQQPNENENDFNPFDDYYHKGVYLDQKNKFQAKPGITYTLLVEVPDGRTITGTTRIPPTPEIVEPIANTLIARTSIRQTEINWVTNPETAAYQIYFILEYLFPEDEFSYRENTLYDYVLVEPPATLNRVPSYQLTEDFRTISPFATIKIMAMDRNYYDYIRTSTGLAEITGTSLDLLEGGVGVFGAVSVDSIQVVLRRDF